jgi:hypothetical protein
MCPDANCTDGSLIWQRAKETMKGRRCIKSDFVVGRKLYWVGPAYRLKEMTICTGQANKVAAFNKKDADFYLTVDIWPTFTTRRAAQAYINSRKGA